MDEGIDFSQLDWEDLPQHIKEGIMSRLCKCTGETHIKTHHCSA
jgi:hypothetical protein